MKIKPKTIGRLMLIPSILITLGSVIFLAFMILSVGEYITWISLSMLFAVGFLLFAIFTLYSSIRYIKKPFQKNKTKAYILIAAGTIFFLNRTLMVILDNVTGANPGAWFQPIIGLIGGSYLVLLGLGFLPQK